MIFDYKYRQTFPMGPLYPIVPNWLHKKGIRSILKKAGTIEGLAQKIDVDPSALAATLVRFNENAEKGVDPDFHRGEAAYDRMYGDPRQQPNPNLRPLSKGPYYAMPIYPGDIGTNGGLLTNDKAQVIKKNGEPIDGLYAIGNNAASSMGESYPGAGVTIGPALTFGYIAARHMSGSND
jgi:3-oxosteroid 1-dehydrogenase